MAEQSERSEALAGIIEASAPLLTRFLAGFDATSATAQAPGLPNHPCWSLGHCALTMLRLREKITGESLPETDFLIGSASGDARRFGTESIAFGSQPVDDPALYPGLERAREIFEGAAEALAASVRGAPESQLDRPVSWHQGHITVHELIARIVFHN